jgi:signal transduction histidine kinase/ActR/RegA family two-component response regulator
VRFPTGEVRTMVLRGRVDFDDAREPRRIIGFIQDITEHVERERALRESRAALNEAQTLGALGHFTLHPPGVQLIGSDEFHRLIGTEEGFYVTVHTLPDRFVLEDRPGVRRALERAVRDGQGFDIEARLGSEQDRSRWVRIKTRVERDGTRLARITGIIQDIEDQKQLEAARVQMSRVDALGQLAGGLAHDFNNFLASVLLNLTTLEDDPESMSEPARGAVRDAVASARAAQLVTRQLMNFSRGSQPVLERVDLRQLVEEAVGFSLRGSGCELIFEAPENPAWVRIDVGQIQQVVNNLVLNARQAQRDEGTLVVRLTERMIDASGPFASSRARWVEVAVQDEGPGIAPEHRDRIFVPYFTTKDGGHGLGLASSFSIIKMHRGDLSFHCPPGGGTVFRFSLPTTEAPERVQAPPEKIRGPGRGRVLVLDDDVAVRRVLSRALARLGFEVALTETGHDTLRAWERAWREGEPFDLLILDLTVSGGLGGVEVFRTLRERQPDLRAIASSGYAGSAAMGPDGVGFAAELPKPYTFSELQQVVSTVMTDTRASA